ncbi:GIY-YIG nuclease family protein [Clostridium perfringens]
MEFKTIYNLQDNINNKKATLETVNSFNNIPNTSGVLLIITSKKKNISISKVIISENLKKDLLGFVHQYKNSSITLFGISYYESNNILENCLCFLDSIKKFNPCLNFKDEVQFHLSIANGLSISNSYDESKFSYLDKNFSFQLNFISKDDIKLIPDAMGIYFMYSENKDLMYIGKSIHLNSRVANHLSGRTHTDDICHNFKYIKYIEIDNEELLDDYETYYINIYKPKLNVSKVYTYRSERYTPKYNSKLNEFINLEHMIQYKIAKEYLEERFKVSKLIAAKEEEMLKDIADMKNLFL